MVMRRQATTHNLKADWPLYDIAVENIELFLLGKPGLMLFLFSRQLNSYEVKFR